MMDGVEMMNGMMWTMWLSGLLLVVVVLVGVVVVVRMPGSGPWWRGSGPDAMGVLEERFARGEIDRDEFEERRRTLRS